MRAPMMERVTQAFEPDTAPPADQKRSDQGRGTGSPQRSRPWAVAGQSETRADQKPDNRPENH